MTTTEKQPEAEAKISPPYVPYKTLASFLDDMRAIGLPDQIDRSVLKKLSGIMQNQLLHSLKFLGLVKDGGEVTAELRSLVAAKDPTQSKEILSRIILSSYAEIIGTINIESASEKQLNDRFREIGKVEGDTLQKATRFYLKALESAGQSYSGFLKQRQPRGTAKRNGSQTPREKAAKGQQEPSGSTTRSNPEPEDSVVPKGMMKIPLYLPGKPLGQIVVTDDLDEADCDMIDTILRAIAKRRNSLK